jgi:cytochrome aa3-600 menaquinol oxidase subunit 2
MPQLSTIRRAASTVFMGVALMFLASGCSPMVLTPAGPVGQEEKHLIILSTILVLIVIIPVILLLAFIVTRYRDKPGNTAPYKPEWDNNVTLEVIWWGIPILIIGILSFATAKTIFALTKPPEHSAKPLTIDVISLNWKWFFEYPDQKIATVNYAVIPTGRPVQFILTADSPMNSFWVPQLGGQEYTMPGMAMRLWLQADKSGTYYGHGANFTGTGFAHDQFNVISKPETDFNTWAKQVRDSNNPLTMAGFKQLQQPSLVKQMQFSAFPAGLFHSTVMKYGGMYMAMGKK